MLSQYIALKEASLNISDVDYIGKESNNLENNEIVDVSDNEYVVYDNKTEQKIADVIKNMTTKDARRIGLSKRQLFRLKKKVKQGKGIGLKKKTLHKLLNIA